VTGDHVTIGVPVYRGERFLDEAVQSILAQTHENYEVVMSLDGPDPAGEDLCRRYLGDPRFRLVVQPERLGWVANIARLMAQAGTDFWYYHQQDDLTDPSYLKTLLDHARTHPEAAVVYSDIEAFTDGGAVMEVFVQPSVTGNPVNRQLTLLQGHLPAVAFRGLTRADALRATGCMTENEVENFASDTVWMSSVALSGELHRVPQVLYRKRYHENNIHTKWSVWPVEMRSRAWMVHCAVMCGQAMRAESSVLERRLLWLAAVNRLVWDRFPYVRPDELSPEYRTLALSQFSSLVEASLDLPALLDAPAENITRWTAEFFDAERHLGAAPAVAPAPTRRRFGRAREAR
jgi:GT2 family glycosyltransferase